MSARETTDANQTLAADPRVSAWVSANAGTGKTHVLVNRILRLLLAGNRPEGILCLTYTRAAAAEMQNRLFDVLGAWATMTAPALDAALETLTSARPSPDEARAARRLFARTLETRGGLKIHTIHAFCERLLHRFPIEAGIPADFTVLDERAASALKQQAVDRVLSDAAREPASALGDALMQVVARSAEQPFREIMEAALGMGVGDLQLDLLRKELGLTGRRDEHTILGEQASVLDDAAIRAVCEVLASGKKTDQRTAQSLSRAMSAMDEVERVRGFREAFLTGAERPYTNLVTKAVREEAPDLCARLDDARDRFYDLEREYRALELLAANRALALLSTAIRDDYEARKAAQAALDYDDLITKSDRLLAGADAASWVLYKLDGGIDHILVDEAQDTSPLQWQVIDALAEEFFAGLGARELDRTVFAVGDEKQSIYSFQGADPAEFAAQGRAFRRRAVAAGKAWHPIPLNLSFRSSKPVLDAVDFVFERPAAANGLTDGVTAISHTAYRQGEAGLVELWAGEEVREADVAGPFDPLGDRDFPGEAAATLAGRIAETIADWRRTGACLASQDRPIQPGDILILVRRRDPFAQHMIRALKARDLPVAGADRMRLQDQLVVQDLMSLGEFLLMPEDDLALAEVLKSPLVGFDDDDLFKIAHGRAGSLWDAFLGHAEEEERYGAQAEWLRGLLSDVDYGAPYELYAGILEEDGMARRRNLLARLGPEAGDALDAFLSQALAYEERAPTTLQGFLDEMRRGNEEVKRDMEQGRDEIRVMTVHGAKGLESNIVFLPDTFARPGAASQARLLPLSREGSPKGGIWPPPGTASLPAVAALKERRSQAEQEEYHRLLYVAMTRARDRLYICGWKGRREPDERCWYNLVREGLAGRLEEATDPRGHTVWRMSSPQEVSAAAPKTPEEDVVVEALPDWACAPVRPEKPAARAITPSAALGEAAGQEQSVASPMALADEQRFLRGQLIHGLLEHLPELAAEEWEPAARRFLASRGGGLSEAKRIEILAETLAVLRDPEFGMLFGPDSLTEVPLVARLSASGPEAPAIEVSGQIDRVAIRDHEVLIVDYKTNRPPPERVEDAAPAYVAQLALYRAAIRRIFPDKPVRAALLWTAIPRLMLLPGPILDDHEARLGIAGMRGLDAPGART